jgi:hypothetical protein
VLTGNPFLKKDIPHTPVPYKILKVYSKATQSFIEIFKNLRTRGYALQMGGHIVLLIYNYI